MSVLSLAALIVGLTVGMPGTAGGQTQGWTTQFGAPGFDVARAIGVEGTSVYVFGAVSDALPGQTYAGGPSDVFLRKYDLAGNEVWTRQFGTVGDDFPMAGPVGIDDTTVYVAGWTNGTLSGETSVGGSDAFLRAYDVDGNELWTEQFGTSGHDFTDGIAVGRGGIFVSGLTDGTFPGQISGGSWDAFVRRYAPDGSVVWTHQLGGAGSEDYHAVAVDRTGVYAAGSITTLPDFEGDEDALVAKYDLGGDLLWTREFGALATGPDTHLEAVAVQHGLVSVAGLTDGTYPGQVNFGGQDVLIRTYDIDGSEVWTRQFGTPGNDGASFRGLAVDGRSVFITGNVAGTLPGQTGAGGRDGFVRRYSLKGDELLTIQFGSAGDDRPIAVAVGEAGGSKAAYVAGRTSGAFPGFANAGGVDAFVVKIAGIDG